MRNESLRILLELAKQRVAQMSDDEYEAMLAEQRLSWVRGEMDISAAERAAPPASPTQGASQMTDALKSAEKALRPFYDAVFNDNGDITVDGRHDYDEAVAGYFAYKKIERAIAAIGAGPRLNIPTDLAWYEGKAKLESDHEVSAGRLTATINPTAEEIAEMERLQFEALPKWAQDEITKLRAAIGTGGQAVAVKPYGYANLYRDEDGDLQLGGVDVYPTPEPEWAEFADDYIGPVSLWPADALSQPHTADERACTCHPDDSPPQPCAEKYALSECRKGWLDEDDNEEHDDRDGAEELSNKLDNDQNEAEGVEFPGMRG